MTPYPSTVALRKSHVETLVRDVIDKIDAASRANCLTGGRGNFDEIDYTEIVEYAEILAALMCAYHGIDWDAVP